MNPLENSSNQSVNPFNPSESLPSNDDRNNQILIILLSVLLPVFFVLLLVVVVAICYRRRWAHSWTKQTHEDTHPLDSIPSTYSHRKHPFLQSPQTETIVFNQINSFGDPSKSRRPASGQTNVAFDTHSIRRVAEASTFTPTIPEWSQSSVSTISPAFVEAIATHRLTVESASERPSSRCAPTVLLFSQRTLF